MFRRQQLRFSCHGLDLELTHRSSFVASPLVCFQCSSVLDRRSFFFTRNPTRFFSSFKYPYLDSFAICSVLRTYVNFSKSLISLSREKPAQVLNCTYTCRSMENRTMLALLTSSPSVKFLIQHPPYSFCLRVKYILLFNFHQPEF